MITEQEKDKSNVSKIESGIRLCEESISKAEKYERLNENKDWQGYLEDLKILADLHEKEIKSGAYALTDAPNSGYCKTDEFGKQIYVSSKQDWADFIMKHQIQREEALKWTREPDYIMNMAKLARERLPMLKKKLEEFKHAAESVGQS